MPYTLDQILQLAPDEASAKAGQQLASSAKWVVRAQHSRALWGDCQGSGKTPYKTIIDLTNIAFKCSCPSRKFPCKHGLGLMLLHVQQPGAFTAESELPAYVSEWLDKRVQKETAKEQKEEKPVDEAAKAKRAESRDKKVAAGIEELRYWIKDVIRTGIMNVPQQAYQFNHNITARMVDAQAGGLANQLRQINKINFYKDGWRRLLTKRLSSIYLATEAYNNAEQLPPAMVQELRTLIGWTTAKEEVMQQPAVTDNWTVLSVTTTEEGNITTERTWMYGSSSGRFALLLNFYAGGQAPQRLFFPGMCITAPMFYYPGVQPLRAVIGQYEAAAGVGITIPAGNDITNLYKDITVQLSQNPFAEQMPFLLYNISLLLKDNKWFMMDEGGKGFAIVNHPDECWRMLAFTKGRGVACFGVYENEEFNIHTLWLNNNICFVK
jgi:hypothetical protein